MSLAAVELGVRLAGLAVPSWVQPDAAVGWSYRPGALYLERSEGYSFGRLNSHGLRDVEHSYAKPAGTFRILVLGDSFTEAFQVPLERSYTRLLERQLQERCDSSRIEVIALARSGMGTAQQRRWFLVRGVRYEPDLVLLQTCINDPIDNVPFLGGRERVPYYLPGPDGRVVLDESFRSGLSYRLWCGLLSVRQRSAAFELAYRSLRAAWAAARQAPTAGDTLPLDAFENRYLPEPPEPWRRALAVTAAVLSGLAEEVNDAGAELVVFGVTDGIELERWGVELAARYGLELDRREAWWREQSKSIGVGFVPLLAEFRRRRASSGRPPHGFDGNLGRGHWNQLGHAWAAELLADSIEQYLPQQPAPTGNAAPSSAAPR